MRKLKVGADPFPPYQYYDENQILKGSDYLKINNILKEMNINYDYVLDDWNNIERKLINKEIDIAFQVQKTSEREELYLFSKLFRNAITSVISSGATQSKSSLKEIINRKDRIAVVEGYKYGDPIDNIPNEFKIFSKDQIDLVGKVKNKLAQFGVVDLGVYEYQSMNNDFSGINILHQYDFERPLYVVFNDEKLRDEFNKYL